MPKKTEPVETTAAEPEALTLAYEPRRAGREVTVGYTKTDGSQATLKADADGVIWPDSPEAVAVLDSFDYPVARKALSEVEDAAMAASEAPKE